MKIGQIANFAKFSTNVSLRYYVIHCVAVVKYCDDMEERVKPLLVKKEPLSEADMEKFGKKDPEAYPF